MEDRSWMDLSSHCCPQYLRGLKSFIQIARANMEARSETTMYCPCLDCGNDKKYSDFEVVYVYLIVRGFVPNYTCWNKHGEEGPNERGNGLPIPKKGAGMMIKMGKATVIKKGAGMTSIRSAFWSSVNTSLMPWSTMLRR